eukprot:1190936-Prorocentrum_minimum.AAC.5
MRNVEASPATPTVLADKPGDDAQPSVKHEDVPPTVPASGPAGEDTKLKKVASSTATAVTTTTPAAGSQEDNPKRKDVTPTDKGAVDIAEKKPSTRLLSDEHPGDASAPQDISVSLPAQVWMHACKGSRFADQAGLAGAVAGAARSIHGASGGSATGPREASRAHRKQPVTQGDGCGARTSASLAIPSFSPINTLNMSPPRYRPLSDSQPFQTPNVRQMASLMAREEAARLAAQASAAAPAVDENGELSPEVRPELGLPLPGAPRGH